MTGNPFQSPDDPKLEIVSIDLARWLSEDDVRIDFSVGYLVPDQNAEQVEPASEAVAFILAGATPLKPAVLSKHSLLFKEIMRLDVFDTESRFASKFSGPWAKFERLRDDIPGIAISKFSNYLDSMELCDIAWHQGVDVYHTHITTFASSVINVLSWDRPVITDHSGDSSAH